MDTEKRRVIETIQVAFRGVKLGGGVGLFESQGIDNHARPEKLAELRATDQKDDWALLDPDDLHGCQSSLSFFDAEGMRFHLPAYLIASLEGTISCDVVFHLAYLETASSTYSLLTADQRKAVREFLLYRLRRCRRGPAGSSDPFEDLIERALQEYWHADE